MDERSARRLLETGEYGFLAMQNCDGGGYGIPLSYALEGDTIYFHCAPEGHKLDNLRAESRVTFCVVGPTEVIPGQFTTAYQSVMAFGRAETGLCEEERRKALWLLVAKYSPGFREVAAEYIEKSFPRTGIIKLRIDRITAKCKRTPPGAQNRKSEG